MVLTRGIALRQPILAPDAEREHIRAWKESKDGKALESITRAYARLCFRIASQYTKDERRMEDLAQEGMFGVWKAVDKYDPEKGTKFSTYSRLWIQNYIAMAASTVLNDITLPSRVYIDAKMGRIKNGANESAVFAAMPFLQFDEPVGADGEATRLDLHVVDDATPEDIVRKEDLDVFFRDLVADALEKLGQREADVIRRRKLQETPDTLDDIAKDFGVTRERIRQIESAALDKLRDIIEASGLPIRALFED